MRKHFSFALVLALLLAAGISGSSQSLVKSAGDSAMAVAAIGSTIADFRLPDADGKEHSLSSLKGKNGAVLIFVSTKCPVSNAYNERMEKLAQDFHARGVHVIGINSNVTESPAEIKGHSAQHKLTFPILKDKGNKLADRLGARRTPEVYFLDSSNKLVYRGRIDNAQNPANISSNDLRDAVDATLAGKTVTRAEANAFGCSIKRAS